MAIYLGFDASTQSLTAILLRIENDQREVVAERTFTYDQELPQYGTRHGVIRTIDPAVVTSPPLMWLDALDHMMASLVASHPSEMRAIAAIAGSAQQHGTVYLNARYPDALAGLVPSMPIAAQLAGTFSRARSPVWMDSSTTDECREIAAALGSDTALARRTGSAAFERFSGPQIRRFFKRDPSAYAETTRIHLVSSFLAAVLAGTDAPIDPSDGAGTCLMDLATHAWWPDALAATAPDLISKLPRLASSSSIVGSLSPYWRERYGLPAARIVCWAGDNGCSMVGTGLVREGRIGISLGTSDVVFGPMTTPRVSANGEGHVYGSPSGGFMGLTVFKNGSLARERVRDQFGLDWSGFSLALRSTPAGNHGEMMLPWFDPEITPHVIVPGVHRSNLDPLDAAGNVRAVVEAQMMAMANHAQWMSVEVDAIHAAGGAAGNADVLQVMADVFGADVYRSQVRNAACLGAALCAWHADAVASGRAIAWDEIVRGVAEPRRDTRIRPNPACVAIYRDLRRRYAAFERAQSKS